MLISILDLVTTRLQYLPVNADEYVALFVLNCSILLLQALGNDLIQRSAKNGGPSLSSISSHASVLSHDFHMLPSVVCSITLVEPSCANDYLLFKFMFTPFIYDEFPLC